MLFTSSNCSRFSKSSKFSFLLQEFRFTRFPLGFWRL
jgi:hypothetical protein